MVELFLDQPVRDLVDCIDCAVRLAGKGVRVILAPNGDTILVQEGQVVSEIQETKFCPLGNSEERALDYLASVGGVLQHYVDITDLPNEVKEKIYYALRLVRSKVDGEFNKKLRQSRYGELKEGSTSNLRKFIEATGTKNIASLSVYFKDQGQLANKLADEKNLPFEVTAWFKHADNQFCLLYLDKNEPKSVGEKRLKNILSELKKRNKSR